jgi:hypothetical protein
MRPSEGDRCHGDSDYKYKNSEPKKLEQYAADDCSFRRMWVSAATILAASGDERVVELAP